MLVVEVDIHLKSYFTHQAKWTTARVSFEVNKRVVLATRSIGVGHQRLVKFCCVMNMLTPIQERSFQHHLKAVTNAAQTAAKRCMSKAADEVKTFYEPEQFERRRGVSSCYRVVTAKSTVTGKALDCEIMSEECSLCVPWRGNKATPEFQDWWEGH